MRHEQWRGRTLVADSEACCTVSTSRSHSYSPSCLKATAPWALTVCLVLGQALHYTHPPNNLAVSIIMVPILQMGKVSLSEVKWLPQSIRKYIVEQGIWFQSSQHTLISGYVIFIRQTNKAYCVFPLLPPNIKDTKSHVLLLTENLQALGRAKNHMHKAIVKEYKVASYLIQTVKGRRN